MTLKKIKFVTVSTFYLSVFHDMMGPDAMILVFGSLNFKTAFSVSSFILVKGLFTSSSPFAVRVISSEYLKLLIFLPVIMMLVSDSLSLAFHKMYSADKLSRLKIIQPCHTPFPVLNQSVVLCLVLTVAS